MRWSVVIALILLAEVADFKGRGGGGGGFKLFSFKKAPSRSAKTAKQKSVPRAASKPSESEITGSKYFNRDVPLSQKDYGGVFTKGLSKNSYIYNNYYRTHSQARGIARYLTNAIFFRMGMKMSSQYDDWNDEDDKKWRMTTKSPYFENKIPGKLTQTIIVIENEL